MHNLDYSDVKEIEICADNPEYFIEKYCFVKHPVCGPVRMDLNAHQQRWMKSTEKNCMTSLGSDRQTGKTQFIAAYALWSALFKNDHTVGIFAYKHGWTKEIHQRISYIHFMLPKLFSIPNIVNKQEFRFENGSSIKFFTISECAGRGHTIGTMLIDGIEYAKDVAFPFLASILPCVSAPSSKVIMTGDTLWQE